MRREWRESFPCHRLQLATPACITARAWCTSGSLTRGGEETFPAFPACAQPAILSICMVTKKPRINRNIIFLREKNAFIGQKYTEKYLDTPSRKSSGPFQAVYTGFLKVIILKAITCSVRCLTTKSRVRAIEKPIKFQSNRATLNPCSTNLRFWWPI